ncbi:MAG TPA: pyridoxamine 5'-phosphate oxidase family protein, partial [Thiobacillaceae bacterium]|nr:pyridoxamine 5'-phosphate oxidase family protein [Thiobacillaceae bacterium]
MAKFFPALLPEHADFIARQKVFFVATQAPGGRINLSPKGLDSLRVLDEQRVAYLDLTGSGAETAAHLRVDPRMTLMLCSFSADALILRLYGQGRS